MTNTEPLWPAIPRPGSPDALVLGCLCPHDQPQAFRGEFWQDENCPIHGKPEKEKERT